MAQSTLDSRKWVLPLVSLIPLAAIVFAFSLGPSPRKRLQKIYESKEVDLGALLEIAESGPDDVYAVLAEDVQRPESPHRAVIIRFLGTKKYEPAGPVFRRLVTTPAEPVAVRTAALKALKSVDPKGVRSVARGVEKAAGPLGEAAKEILGELSSADQS